MISASVFELLSLEGICITVGSCPSVERSSGNGGVHRALYSVILNRVLAGSESGEMLQYSGEEFEALNYPFIQIGTSQ